ncbi:SAV_2336 N-terminal domain-related protein [Streptomyces sp. M41]|uniref:SAV_2336 N-terminal domain-related protein n=1 Tax=Streptomyces sp. M41 TaxID=3059412 RepID=UPI00374D50C9
MPSERAGRRPPLVRLAAILAEAAGGVRPTPLELAELLWLARHMEPGDRPPSAAPAPRSPAEDAQPPETAPTPTPPPPGGPPHIGTPPPPTEAPRAPLHLPAPAPVPDRAPKAPTGPAEPHTALLAPAPPMLRHPLALQRSLRPLKRRTEAPDRLELDERATADRIARLGAEPQEWLPVLRPARERWLRLHLVYDAGPTMPVWRPLIRELHAALAQSGVFRTVTLRRADPDGTVRHGAAPPADGRTVTLLVSDCMGPQWRPGPAGLRWYRTLRRWAHHMPLAVVQPLPEHLWQETALPAVAGRLSAPHPAAPAASLTFVPYDDVPEEAGGAVALPVLEPGADWLANWAALIAAPGGKDFPGAAARLTGAPPAPPGTPADGPDASPEDLVLRFRASASPEAFRLAGHLAVGRPDLPVMRLVQAALEPRPRPQHLAEVILSGMLTRVPGPPGSYAFRPGVRELLLLGLPRTARGRTTELLARVGGLIDERAGAAPGEFRASTPAASGTRTAVDGEPFATVSAERLGQLGSEQPPAPPPEPAPAPSPAPELLGDRYQLLEKLSPYSEQWRARDLETDRLVTVRLIQRVASPGRRSAFLRDARLLLGVEHPHVATVHDFGFSGETAYLVSEHLDGTDLNSLVAGSGYELPAPLLVPLAAQLAGAVLALHDAGVTHGGLNMPRVVLLPDGTVKLTHARVGRSAGPDGRAEDRRALVGLLFQLAAGPSGPRLPVQPHTLAHLPPAVRPPFADALNELLSPARARDGLDRLTALGGSPLLQEGFEQRRYFVLGPLRAEFPDRPRHVPPDCAAMLAMLLFKHGRAATHEELTAGLWEPSDRPADTAAELSRMASRLRISLGPGALSSHSGSRYSLHTSVDYVDVLHCDELVRQADEARAAGSFADAHALVGAALDLFDGDTPLAGVRGPAARTARTRLQQLRLGLLRTSAELDLELGEFERAAVDLGGLVDAHPAREDFRRLYLIALRRQGRVDEALEVYEEYELSGGQNLELLAMGRELRDEFDDRQEGTTDSTGYEEFSDPAGTATDTDIAYGFGASPYDLPDGAPLSRDHPSDDLVVEEDTPAAEPAPDGLFVVEDTLAAESAEDAYDEPPEDAEPEEDPDVDLCDCVGFEFADDAPSDEARAELDRLVTILVESSGLLPEEYMLRHTARGILLRLQPYWDGGPVFRATVAGLPELLGRLEGCRLRVEFWRALYGPDPGDESDDRPGAEAVAHALDLSGQRAVIACSEFWHAMEIAENSLTADRFARLSDGSGWYSTVHPAGVPEPQAPIVLVDMTDMLRDPAFTGPPTPPAGRETDGDGAGDGAGAVEGAVNDAADGVVDGPFPVPVSGAVPGPRGEGGTVVVALPGGELVPADYAVVRMAPPHVRATWQYFEVDLTERRLAPEDVPGVEVRWRVNDAVTAVQNPDLDVPGLLTGVLRDARGLYGNDLRHALSSCRVPGHLVHWSLPTVFRTAAAGMLPHWGRPPK